MKRNAGGILWLGAVFLGAMAVSSIAIAAGEPAQKKEKPTPRTGVGDVKKPEAPSPGEQDEKEEKGPFAGLKFRFIGPPGNRVSAVVGVPGDPNVYYAGAASGGVWKSMDGGTEWKPVFDEMPAQSIGAIAIAPPDPIDRLGRHGRDVHPQQRLDRRRRLQVDRRWEDVEAHGPGEDRPHRPGHHRPAQSGRRVRRRARHLLRPSAGAGRLPDPRRREDLGAHSLRRRKHGRFRPDDGPHGFAHALRGHVADRHQDLGAKERRPGERRLGHARRGREVEAPDRGRRASRIAAREDRRRRRPERPRPRVRADRNGGQGLPLAIGQRRKEVEAREPQPAPERAPALLLANARHARQRERGLLSLEFDGRDVRRRRNHRPGGLGGRQPRHVGRSDESEPHDDRQRHRRRDLDDARKEVELGAAADRPDVPRRDGHAHSLQRLRADAGRRVDARPEPQPRRRHDPSRALDDDRGMRNRMEHPGPGRSEHRLGRLLRGGGRALRRAHADVALGLRLAGSHDGRQCRRGQVPNELDVSDRDLAARPQPGLRREPVRPRNDRRGRALEDDQPRPDPERPVDDGGFGRADDRQPLGRVRERRLFDRRVPAFGGRDLGRERTTASSR